MVHAVGTTAVYEIHGLFVRADFPVGRPCAHSAGPVIDVVRRPSRPIPAEAPHGDVLATVESPVVSYWVVRDGEGRVRARYAGACEILLSADRTRAEVTVDPSVAPDSAGLFLGGSFAAFLLGSAGQPSYHSSAVVLPDGRAVAFVGASGAGKSTLACLLRAAGCSLVTDDLLRLRPHESGFECLPGSSDIRLRESAAGAATLVGIATRRSPDGRVLVEGGSPQGPWPLAGFVLPSPSRTEPSVRIERLSRNEAFLNLARNARVAGWRLVGPAQDHFALSARVARTVPMVRAVVPWGPPWEMTSAETLLRTITKEIAP